MIYGECTVKVQNLSKTCTIRTFKKCNVDALTADLVMAPWQVMGIFDHIDDKWSYWKSLFLNVIDSHAPLMKVRVKQSGSCDDWIDSELRSLMRTRNYYHKKHQRTHDPVDWEMFKSLRKQVNHQLKRAKADHYTAICKDMSRNAKPTWDHFNSAPGRTSRKPINSIKSL